MNRKARVTSLLRHLLTGLVFAIGLQSAASWAACTAGNPNANLVEAVPSADLTDNSDGTVTHSRTGLMWKQCPEGLSTTSTACDTGTAATMDWSTALTTADSSNFAGYLDWRLPNVNELASLIETCGYTPAINQSLFPATPTSSPFWTASTYVPTPANAWHVDFDNGYNGNGSKALNRFVRLVRGGASFGAFDAFDVQAPILYFPTEGGYGTDGVYPDIGSLSATFIYKVVYTHAHNTAPTLIRACIDTVCHAMSLDTTATADLHNGEYTNGEQYVYITTLPLGSHTYYFDASDGTTTVTLPFSPIQSLPGPSVLPVSAPDLTVSALSSPSEGGSVFVGSPITITDSVTNQGTSGTNAPGGIMVSYRLGGELIGSRTISGLAAGATDTASHDHTLTASFAPGVYQLTATVDPNQKQGELNEANNTTTALGVVTVVRAVDLVPTSLVPGTPSVTVGTTLVVNDTVANQGNSPTSAPVGFRVNYYLSTDTTITAADTLLSGRNILKIAAGAADTAATTVSIPAGMTPGVYYLGSIADSGNAQPETNENNNTLAGGPVTVMAVVGGVDLAPTAINTPATTVYTGGSFNYSGTIKNQGNVIAKPPGGFQLNFYLSKDAVITTGDMSISSQTITSLAAGASSSTNGTHTVPAAFAPGVYYLGIFVDNTDKQSETNETNNSLATAGTITIVRDVDLVSNSIGTTATTATRGGTIVVNDVVENTGNSPTWASSFRVNYYLSKDATITAADTLLSGRNIGKIASGATNSASTTVSIPAGMAPGVYYLGEIVDSGSAQPETDEGNNTGVTAGTVTVQ